MPTWWMIDFFQYDLYFRIMYIVFTDFIELSNYILNQYFAFQDAQYGIFMGKDDTYNCDDTP